MGKRLSRCGRHSLRRVRAREDWLLFEASNVKPGGGFRQRLIWAVVDVHQAEVEVFTIIAAVSGFVVILKPVGSDHVRYSQEGVQRGAESGGAFLLRGDDGEHAAIVFVAAAIVSSAKVKLADRRSEERRVGKECQLRAGLA